jgi:hypothetical protein
MGRLTPKSQSGEVGFLQKRRPVQQMQGSKVPRYLGIDFSGGAAPWRPVARKPTVWIATVEAGSELVLADLRPVQHLPGTNSPFTRLAKLLEQGDFTGAAIDAPFSLPAAHMPVGGMAELLALVAGLPHGEDRPFARGACLVALGERFCTKQSPKPLRQTERYWMERGVNTRSTLWNGPRGGAPFAAACLSLLAQARRPLWPWDGIKPGFVCEAFPAAQLCQWNLPFSGYGKPEQETARKVILEALGKRMAISTQQLEMLLQCPDALDAVIASFGAIAIHTGTWLRPVHDVQEGLVAVMER